ncbi:noncanonical pyrimidine nucleotidase, YjjG family, partial [Streptococcus pyogenes]
MHYNFLFFDLDHTLLDFDAAEEVALTKLLEEYQV